MHKENQLHFSTKTAEREHTTQSSSPHGISRSSTILRKISTMTQG